MAFQYLFEKEEWGMGFAYGGAMPRIRMHVSVHTYAWVDVNVCIRVCIRTCPADGFMPFESPLLIEPVLSIYSLFSERAVLYVLRLQKHGLR